MKLHTVWNHVTGTARPARNWEHALMTLQSIAADYRDNGVTVRSCPSIGTLFAKDGVTVIAEVQIIDVDTLWDIETLVVLQQANGIA